jgi:GAF domain-containing protein
MPRKPSRNLQQHNRIQNLFADLDLESGPASPPDSPLLLGWVWECDGEGRYTSISPEVNLLGWSAQDFLGQSLATFALDEASQLTLIEYLEKNNYQSSVNIAFINTEDQKVPVTLYILPPLSPIDGNGKPPNLRGYARLIQDSDPAIDAGGNNLETLLPSPNVAGVLAQEYQPDRRVYEPGLTIGYLVESENCSAPPDSRRHVTQVSQIMTSTGQESLALNQPIALDTQGNEPAVLAVPMVIGENRTNLLLELLDDQSQRTWSEDERLLVEQVTDQLALALENAQLIAQTQRALTETEDRANELTILNEMSRAFASNLEVEPVIEFIFTYTSKLMDTSNFYLALYNPEDEAISFHHVTADGVLVEEGHPEWEYWSKRQPLSGLTSYVIKERKPLLLEKNALQVLEAEHRPYVAVGSGGVESWLGVPMAIGDQVIGAIGVQSETIPNLYNHRHRELLTTIGNQGAIAIQNARLLQETRKRNQDLATINTIISAASRTLDITTMLEAVLSQVLSSTGFHSGLVTVFNPVHKKLYLAAQSNLPASIAEIYSSSAVTGTLSEYVFDRGEVFHIEKLEERTPADAAFVTLDTTRTLNLDLR